MCAWEQDDGTEFPSLRKRLPVLNERIWNTEEAVSYTESIKKMELLDSKLSLITAEERQDNLLYIYNFVKED